MATITFEQALGSLTSMFPRIDVAVIEAVLEGNSGAMEPTVEQLLTLDPEAPSEPAAAPASGQPAQPVPPASAQNAPGQPQQWRHPLPADYLVLPPVIVQMAGHGGGAQGVPGLPAGADDATAAQMLADQQMAEMLQNELFLEELRGDPEFAAYLRAHPEAAAALGVPVPPHPSRRGQPASGYAGGMARVPARGGGGSSSAYPGYSGADAVPTWRSSSSNGARGRGGSGADEQQHDRDAPQVVRHSGSAGSGNGVGAFFSGMGSDMRRRFNLLQAKFQRKQGSSSSGMAAAPVRSSGASGRGGLLSGLFDGRGAYAALPHADAGGAAQGGHGAVGSGDAFTSISSGQPQQHGRRASGGMGGGGFTDEVEIELTHSPRDAMLAGGSGAAAAQPAPGGNFSINGGGGSLGALHLPAPKAGGDVATSNPVFAIGEEDDEEEGDRVSLRKRAPAV